MTARPMKNFAEARRGTGSGFTLLELLVVISILGVVSGIGMQAFFGMTSAWSDLKSRSDLDGIAYSAFQRMHADFADVISAELSGVSIRGIAAEREYDALLAPYKDDQIILPIQTSAVGRRNLIGGSVRYRVARDDAEGTHRLVREVGLLTADLPIGAQTAIIDTANVLSLRFEFLGRESGEWQLDWNSPELPAAVRVSLTLADLNRIDLQVSRKTVFPIHVR